MQKGSAPILSLIVIVVLIVLGIYFYVPKGNTQLPTANPISKVLSSIQTYTNSSLGFEFVYPKDMIAKEDSEEAYNQRAAGGTVKAAADFRKNFKGYVAYEPGKFVGAAVVLDKDNSYDKSPLTIWVFDNPEDLSIDAWYKNYWYYPFVWGDFTYTGKVELAPKSEATVSGEMGKSGVIDYQPGKPKFVYVSKDKKMYLFKIIGAEGDKILSTFKFI